MKQILIKVLTAAIVVSLPSFASAQVYGSGMTPVTNEVYGGGTMYYGSNWRYNDVETGKDTDSFPIGVSAGPVSIGLVTIENNQTLYDRYTYTADTIVYYDDEGNFRGVKTIYREGGPSHRESNDWTWDWGN